MCKTCITILFLYSQGICADIWSSSKCKKKMKAGECDTACTTDDCVKTQANCKKKCKICSQGTTTTTATTTTSSGGNSISRTYHV